MDPGPFTMRQLDLMGRARCRYDWQQTCEILAVILNVHRDLKRTPPIRAAELNPFATAGTATRHEVSSKEGIALLKRQWLHHG